MYKLTEQGIKECEHFIAECKAKRKEILEANKVNEDSTIIPTVRGIEWSINREVFDGDKEYHMNWGVTDNYASPIRLVLGTDFIELNN